MKKLIIVLFFILILLVSFFFKFFVQKQFYNISKDIKDNNIIKLKNPEKLFDDIYIYKDSIEKNQSAISGWFKMYNTENTYTSNIDTVPIYYSLIKYEAYCQSNVLCIKHIKQFNEEGNLLSDEPNNSDICPDYSGFVNGEIYFNALCNIQPDRE